MESIIVACITGVVTLVGVILSNSKSRAVMEVKLDALTAKVERQQAHLVLAVGLEGGIGHRQPPRIGYLIIPYYQLKYHIAPASAAVTTVGIWRAPPRHRGRSDT